MILIAGLSIGTITAVAAAQLLRVLFLEVAGFFSEAWHNPESH